MPVAVIWLIFALVLAGAEALTGDMFLLMLGGGALAASATSWLMDWPVWADGPVFLIVSVLLLVLVRPALRRRLTPAAGRRWESRRWRAESALVLDRVARDEGQVKLDGQVWTARPFNDGDVYEPGESVTVMHIDGATAVVFRTYSPSADTAKTLREKGTPMQGARCWFVVVGRPGDLCDHRGGQVGCADPAGRGRGDRTAGSVQPHGQRAADVAGALHRPRSARGWTCASGWCRSRRSR